MSHKTIAVLAGDGIGPEVMQSALAVLTKVGTVYNREFRFTPALVGGAAFEVHGSHFPDQTRLVCESADAILFGSVGGPVSEGHLPKWRGCETNSILALRKTFQLSANFRPARVYKELPGSCPLRDEITSSGVDLVIVRELQGDVYFGEHTFFSQNGKRCARDSGEYSEEQIAPVARLAFEAARKRRKRLTSVDKANVLHTSKLWREVVREISEEYPDVTFDEMLVDNCALQLVKDPGQFDVLVTSNLFGDILSDLAAALPGSLGLTPSASLASNGFGLYEPSGGSAPDIAGRGIANPIAQILSAAMMLQLSFSWLEEAAAIERAVQETLMAGYRTRDIAQTGEAAISNTEITSKIIERIR
jgi:3-isopropylmalate dehydrogenase